MGFLKYLLLLIVKVILALIIPLLLVLIFLALSKVGFIAKIANFALILLGIGESNAHDVTGFIVHGGAYGVCFLLAEKMNAHKPFVAVCITGIVIAVIGGVLNIVNGQFFYPNIVELFISICALAATRKH